MVAQWPRVSAARSWSSLRERSMDMLVRFAISLSPNRHRTCGVVTAMECSYIPRRLTDGLPSPILFEVIFSWLEATTGQEYRQTDQTI